MLAEQEGAGWDLKSLLGQIVVFGYNDGDDDSWHDYYYGLCLQGVDYKKRSMTRVDSKKSCRQRFSNGCICLLVECDPSKSLKVSLYDPNKDEFIESNRKLTKIAASESELGVTAKELCVYDDGYIWIGGE